MATSSKKKLNPAKVAAAAALPLTPDARNRVVQRKAELEAEVAAGKRDANSLVAIPRELAVNAKVTFPDDAFGPPADW